MPNDNAYLDILWDIIRLGSASLGAWFGRVRLSERKGAESPSEAETSFPAERSGAKSRPEVEASFHEGSGKKSASEIKASFHEGSGKKPASEIKASFPEPSGAKSGFEVKASYALTDLHQRITCLPSYRLPEPSGPNYPSEVKAFEYQVWALIIGINDYASKRPLSGAVADANAMNEYLETSLKIPKDHIVNLRDQEATRSKIISAFKGLRDNDRIKKQDPILIYYAGHGGEVRAKNDGHKIQALIPVDYAAEKIFPIPDRTVARLINDIAKKHGNNITVILDCCHSGSGTRGKETDNSIVRGCELSPNDVPDDLDAHIWKANPEPESEPTANSATRGLVSARGFAVRGMKSHILLAACSANEDAREDFKAAGGEAPIARGRFTTALLELFETVHPNQITYAEVLTKILPIDGQNPQCEGFHNDRILFDAKVGPPTRKAYEVRFEDQYILEAGKAHGITDGAEFTLYRNKKVALLEAPLGVMKAKDGNISVFTTVLEPVGELPAAFDNPAIAIQTRAGASEDLLIHVPWQGKNEPIFEAIAQELSGEGPNPCRIKLVDKDKAKLEIVTTEGNLTFTALDERAKEYGFTRMPHVVNANVGNLRHILRGAAHYHFHLNLQHPNNKIRNKISIEFFPLTEELDEDDDIILSPVEQNMIQGGRIEYEVQEGTKYGMRITNQTPWSLYFSCFYFDHADFSITALTEVSAQTPHQKDYSLEKGAKVDIGYGDSSVPPFESVIAKGLDLTFGFLKFYFTSEVVDLSHIPQKSPFYSTRGFMIAKRSPTQKVYGTVLIPVIQRRKRKL
ncbi:hypothetical protein H1R20_g10309, partial [Candolleomyces eurysporus]